MHRLFLYLARPLFPYAGVLATEAASQQPTVSANAFWDDGKRSINESRQSTSLQAKSSPPMLAPRHPSPLRHHYLYRASIAGVLPLVRRVRQFPCLPRKLSTLDDNKTTHGEQSSHGQTGVTYDRSPQAHLRRSCYDFSFLWTSGPAGRPTMASPCRLSWASPKASSSHSIGSSGSLARTDERSVAAPPLPSPSLRLLLYQQRLPTHYQCGAGRRLNIDPLHCRRPISAPAASPASISHSLLRWCWLPFEH